MPEATARSSDAFIIVPAFNEMPVFVEVLRELVAAYANVVVVDDGSTDGTGDAARAIARWTLRHPVNRGQGAALQTGIEFALARGAELVVTFDADGQHAVGDIEALLAPIRRGAADIVLGSRFLEHGAAVPPVRGLVLRGVALMTRFFSRVRVTDAHNGRRAFSRRGAASIHITMDRMAHASEILDLVGRSGLRYCEVPVHVRYTEHSLAKGQTLGNAPRVLLHYVLGRVLR